MSGETLVRRNSGWMLIFGVAVLQTFSAVFLLAFSGSQTFEADTGVAWSELSSVFPTVATQFAIAQQASLVATLAIGLLSLAITYFALRKGQRWAWFAAWILPANMLPGIVGMARTELQAGVALFGGAVVLIAIAGLAISYRTTNGDWTGSES